MTSPAMSSAVSQAYSSRRVPFGSAQQPPASSSQTVVTQQTSVVPNQQGGLSLQTVTSATTVASQTISRAPSSLVGATPSVSLGVQVHPSHLQRQIHPSHLQPAPMGLNTSGVRVATLPSSVPAGLNTSGLRVATLNDGAALGARSNAAVAQRTANLGVPSSTPLSPGLQLPMQQFAPTPPPQMLPSANPSRSSMVNTSVASSSSSSTHAGARSRTAPANLGQHVQPGQGNQGPGSQPQGRGANLSSRHVTHFGQGHN